MPPLRRTLIAQLLAMSLAKTTAMMIVSFAQLSNADSMTRQQPNDGTHFLKDYHVRRSPHFLRQHGARNATSPAISAATKFATDQCSRPPAGEDGNHVVVSWKKRDPCSTDQSAPARKAARQPKARGAKTRP